MNEIWALVVYSVLNLGVSLLIRRRHLRRLTQQTTENQAPSI